MKSTTVEDLRHVHGCNNHNVYYYYLQKICTRLQKIVVNFNGIGKRIKCVRPGKGQIQLSLLINEILYQWKILNNVLKVSLRI